MHFFLCTIPDDQAKIVGNFFEILIIKEMGHFNMHENTSLLIIKDAEMRGDKHLPLIYMVGDSAVFCFFRVIDLVSERYR